MAKVLTLKKKILSRNDETALKVQKLLHSHNIASLNFMASPGGGKTSCILKTITALQKQYRIGVIDGDVNTIDVEKIQETGVPVELADTKGACHLEAHLILTAANKLPLQTLDLLIVENVGNLVCPASFDLGVDLNIVIASVPEGDDKPYKYPKMYKGADIILLNKIDYLETESFDLDYFTQGIKVLNPKVKIFPISCKTGTGIDAWITWLEKEVVIQN